MTQVLKTSKNRRLWRECSQPTFLSPLLPTIVPNSLRKTEEPHQKCIYNWKKPAVKTIAVPKITFPPPAVQPTGRKKRPCWPMSTWGKSPTEKTGLLYPGRRCLLRKACSNFAIERILFLGDLFHSDQNNAWHLFAAWVEQQKLN